MSNPASHFCPGCGSAQQASPRYPWHFCRACCDTAQDGNGRPLGFGNASVSGGLIWRFKGAEVWQGARLVHCLIHARPVRISEARFGGVVAEPLTSHPDQAKGLVDLTRKT